MAFPSTSARELYTFTSGTYNAGGTTTIASTAAWKFTGSATIASAVGNYGTIEVESGTLTIEAAESGTGTILLDRDVSLDLAAPANFTNSISDFAIGDTIDLLGVSATAASVNNSDQLVVTNGGAAVATLQLTGTVPSGSFFVTSDGSGGSDITVASGTPPAPMGLALTAGTDSGVKGDDITNVTTPTITGIRAGRYASAL